MATIAYFGPATLSFDGTYSGSQMSSGYSTYANYKVSISVVGSWTFTVTGFVNGVNIGVILATSGSGTINNVNCLLPLATATGASSTVSLSATLSLSGGSGTYTTTNDPRETVYPEPPDAPGQIASVTVSPTSPGHTAVSWTASANTLGYFITSDHGLNTTQSGTSLTDTTSIPASTDVTYTVTPYNTNSQFFIYGHPTSGTGRTGDPPAAPAKIVGTSYVDHGAASVVLAWANEVADSIAITRTGLSTTAGATGYTDSSSPGTTRPLFYTVTPSNTGTWGTTAAAPTIIGVGVSPDSGGILVGA